MYLCVALPSLGLCHLLGCQEFVRSIHLTPAAETLKRFGAAVCNFSLVPRLCVVDTGCLGMIGQRETVVFDCKFESKN